MRVRAPGITWDETKQAWRVIVTINGTRVFRRAQTLPRALALREELLAGQDPTAFERLKRGDTVLDLRGLTDQQIATILVLIRSWGVPDPLQEEDA